MSEIKGTTNKFLEVDLTTGKFEISEISSNDRKLYLGAKGLGLKLIYDRMKPGVDPLGEENIFALMPGVLMGTGAPCSGRFDAITKSPLTGIMITSSCGGSFGMQLKTAGWDGLLIKGKAEKPVTLEINSDGVEFKDASDIWGMEITPAQEKLKGKKRGTLVIGPAGEKLVKYANVASGHRFLGRGGMGAVLGSKNLKAVVATGGTYKIKPVDEERFNKLKKKATLYIKRNESSINYKHYGTNSNLKPIHEAGMLPINNFKDGQHQDALKLSGETIQKVHNTKHSTCKPCTILCGHKGDFGGVEQSVPEYETIGLLGSNIGVFDSEKIGQWNTICSEIGIDTISAGGTIAWAMEATEKGLIKSELKFGEPEGVSDILKAIGKRDGLGDDLAEGSRALSKKYGGEEFAVHVKGLEMAAYDPRGSYGQGLAYSVANRGACHLSAYLVAMEIYFKLLKTDTTAAKPEFTKFFEDLTCCINSLQSCQFTMFAYTLESPMTKYTPDFINAFFMQNFPKIAVNLVDYSLYTDFWTSITGIKMSGREFLKAGERIHVLERYMNTREGISKKDDTLPKRFLNETRACDSENKTVPLSKMIDKYYKVRGFDSDGIPTEKLLKKLEIV